MRVDYKFNFDEYFRNATKNTAQDILDYIDESWSGGETSSPGSPPAVDTGHLKSSIVSKTEDNKIIIESGADYTINLEMGDKDNAPRPFLRPALNRSFDFAVKRLKI